MSISYHGVVGHTAKNTLPSVESWGANMNILRDPSKGIHTRKIDKVGELSDITQMMQESGDRACESIMTYARGVNPMVAVSYNNSSESQQAFLPYRIMDGGAFRPPARTQRELLPLSRLPRVWTSAFTQPGFADYSKQAECGRSNDGVKSVEQRELLKACIRPTATYKIEVPVTESFDVRYVIKNPVMVEGNSGVSVNAKFNGVMGDVTQQIIENPLHTNANMNYGGSHMKRDVDHSHFNTENYTHDAVHAQATSNPSRDIYVGDFSELEIRGQIKDQFNIPYTANQIGHNKYDYIHDDVELERTLPYYEARTNISQNIYNKPVDHVSEWKAAVRPTASGRTNIGTNQYQVIDTISSRTYNIRPTINPGGYVPNATLPNLIQENQNFEGDTHKSNMRSRVYEMQQGRHGIGGMN